MLYVYVEMLPGRVECNIPSRLITFIKGAEWNAGILCACCSPIGTPRCS